MFKDAMKLGGAIIQIINLYKKKNSLNKSRFFDFWKMQTLITKSLTKNDQSRASSNMIQIIH